ncbi:MAG: Trk family potassium uptake protein, partial [Firmicutes bacterium]|nr:Trk family potassium uptake protein [Bacillota bacterium]
LFVGGALIISTVEGLPVGTCLFETASAVGTVGLTLGITPGLGMVSRIILMILMFLGRVGGLTLIFAASSGFDRNLSRLPREKISVG